jgi:hypothetical protein
MKFSSFLPIALPLCLVSCYPAPSAYYHDQPAPQYQQSAPPPVGTDLPRKAYGVAREAAGVINTARTIESVF